MLQAATGSSGELRQATITGESEPYHVPQEQHNQSWVQHRHNLQVPEFKTSIILAKIGRKPGWGGTGGRRDGTGLRPFSCPGDDGV